MLKSKNTHMLIITFITILLIFLLGSTSNAYKVGDKVMISGVEGWENTYTDDKVYNIFDPDSQFFCIQQGQAITYSGSTYECTGIANITGDEEHNFIMCVIGDQSNTSQDGHYTRKQEAVYTYFPIWAKKYGHGWENFATNSGGSQNENQDWINYAKSEYQKWKNDRNNTTLIKNKTASADSLGKELYTYNGQTYIKVGPYNFTYGTHKDLKFTVTDQNNKTLNVIYGYYSGNDFKVTSNASTVQVSNQDFYILVNTSSNATEVNLKVDISKDSYTYTGQVGSFVFKDVPSWIKAEGITSSDVPKPQQRIISLYAEKKTEKISDSAEVTGVKLTGDLEIIKTDKDTGEKLDNVGIVLYNEDIGQYVASTSSSGLATYTSDASKAKEFITGVDGDSGKILVKGLVLGNYRIYETKNPNPGYKNDYLETSVTGEQVATVVLNKNGTTSTTVPNEMIVGSLEIVKLDEETQVPINGIGFVVYSVDKQQYVASSGSASKEVLATYTSNRDEAKEFITGVDGTDGKIVINALEFGEYIVYESSNSDYRYEAVIDDVEMTTVEFAEDGDSITIYNKMKYGDMEIIKSDKKTNEPLSNVGIVIYNVDKGQYVASASSTEEVRATYTSNREEAQEFRTDENGRIYVKGLEFGNYIIYESDNPNYRYEAIVTDKELATVVFDQASLVDGSLVVQTYNEMKNGDLEIVKSDEETFELLNGVGFVLYNVDKGQYVKTASSTEEVRATYTSNRDEAKEFITGVDGSEGRVYVKGLEFGNYIVYESSNSNFGYEVIVEDKDLARVVLDQDSQIEGDGVQTIQTYNKLMYGDLEIHKRDEDTKNPLNNVGFVIYNVDKGQYIETASSTEEVIATFTSDRDKAKVFRTGVDGEDGQIFLKGVEFGNYIIYEVDNPNYGYEVIVDDKNVASIEFTRYSEPTIIENKRIYVKLSGYVWEDIGKEIKEGRLDNNNLYQSGADDTEDKLLENVTVRLKDRNGEILQETTTNSDGKYTFVDVLIDELENYYIEFSYNGIAYESVDLVDITNTKGTDAIEGDNRQTFNENFAQIAPNQSNNSNGTKTNDIRYNSGEYSSTINYEGNYLYGYDPSQASDISEDEYRTYYPINGVASKYLITATTYNAYRSVGQSGYLSDIVSATDIRNNAIEEIGTTFEEGINLGVVKRERPDLSVVKDLDRATVSISGTQHVYLYGDRFNEDLWAENSNGVSGHELDPKVKFEEKYAEMTYSRALYASDVYYNGVDPLTVQLTYKIAVRNNSTSLNANIYELDDYFDTKFSLVAIGTDINDDGSIKSGTEITNYTAPTNVNSEYNKMTIGGNNSVILELEPLQEKYVYVQLQVNRDNIVEIVETLDNEYAKLDNIAEIRKYGITDDGAVYAGIDKDSQPGNTNPSDRSTWEDDTDKAPGLLLVLQGERTVNGKVFLDSDENAVEGQEIHTGIARQGNGHYDDDEPGIENVKVTLVDADGNIAEVYNEETGAYEQAVTYTNENGEYTLDGFKPGEYQVQYTWGGNIDGSGINSTYTVDNGEEQVVNVQNYKSTIVDKDVWIAKGTNDKWYEDSFKQSYPNLEWNTLTNTEIRASDAVDNYETRVAIDSETQEITYGEKQKFENTYSSDTEGEKYANTQMNSNTQNFTVYIEYTDTENIADNITDQNYNIQNNVSSVDLGIIERAKQILELDKSITSAKVTLANGNILINARMENGQLVEQVPYVSVIPESPGANAQIRVEVDQEIIQGATVEIDYGLKVTNNSELEYQTQEFYMYGQGNGEDATKMVTLQPALIIDYLDNNLTIDSGASATWDAIAQEDRKAQLIDTGLLTGDLESYLAETNRVVTTDEGEGKMLVPAGLETGDENSVSSITLDLGAYKLLSSNGDETFSENNAEIIKVVKNNGGSMLITTPGNYVPTDSSTREPDDSTSESFVILPPTGLTTNYVSYIIMLVSSLAIVTAGIILIRKFVLKK